MPEMISTTDQIAAMMRDEFRRRGHDIVVGIPEKSDDIFEFSVRSKNKNLTDDEVESVIRQTVAKFVSGRSI